MYKVSLLTVLFFVAINYNVVTTIPLKIVNGTSAEEGEFPYMVQLRESKGHFDCGGSIIAPQWILTAGHCVAGNVIKSIVYGTNKMYTEGDGYPNTSIKVKKSYVNLGKSDDLALLQLETEIPFGDNTKPITLPNHDDVPFHIKEVLTGWGRNSSLGEVMPYLQKIHLELQTDQECTKALVKDGQNDFNSTLMLCPENNWNGQCTGDSGGPYVINGIQYGIVSWSYKPCGSHPGVYTRVSFPGNREWIRKITNV